MTVIETTSLSKRYGALRAVSGLSLSVSGRATGLLGPNGAGKSTLVKILLGLIPATSGGAAVLGRDCARDAIRIREEVGYMPENESFIPGLDAVGFVHLAGRLVGMPHADAMQRAHLVLDYVGIDEQRYRKIETYSTGTKQKVKLAQALVHHPRLLLLDEPTAGLDPRGREEMLDLVRDLARRKGMHVVLSTHILPDVEATCDEVVIMDRGKLVRQVKIEELQAEAEAGFEVRVKGDGERFREALGRAGLEARSIEDGEGDAFRVKAASGTGTGTETTAILRAAVEAGVQVRHLAKTRSSLEDLFAREVEGARRGPG